MSKAKALVVGVNTYAKTADNNQNQINCLPDLWCAENDAVAVEKCLKDLGFDTACLLSPDTDRIKSESKLFFQDAERNDVVLFYYSGHGVSYNDFNVVLLGSNETENSYKYENGGVSVGDIIEDVEDKGCHVVLLIDCCRMRCMREAERCHVKRIDISSAVRCDANSINTIGHGSNGKGRFRTNSDPSRGGSWTRWAFLSCGSKQFSYEPVGYDTSGELGHGVYTEALLHIISVYKTRKRYFSFDHAFGDDLKSRMIEISREHGWPEQEPERYCYGSIGYRIHFPTANSGAKVYSLSDDREREDIMLRARQADLDEFELVCDVMLPTENNAAEQLRAAYDRYFNLAQRGSASSMYCVGLSLISGRGASVDVEEGVRWLRQSGERGCSDAYFALGHLYEEGKIVVRDQHKGYQCYEMGARMGSPASLRAKGLCLLFGRGVEVNEAEAMRCLASAEQHGDVVAQFYLGICFANGWGCTKDERTAALWYTKAAARGDAASQCNLGYCYGHGVGVVKNNNDAFRWYQMAANKSIPQAMFNIGIAYLDGDGVAQDEVEAVKWFERGALQGDVESQYNLAICYEDGAGVKKNQEKAAEWYEKAALQGDKEAQCHIGYCYDMGEGVKQDVKKAAEWYLASAKQEYAEAQFNIGNCYIEGRGVARNAAEAVKWWLKAAKKGDTQAQYNLGISYHDGDGVQKDVSEAVKWWFRAAIQGVPLAQYSIGVCYETGDGIEKDVSEAEKWYHAAANECEAAFMALERLKESRRSTRRKG